MSDTCKGCGLHKNQDPKGQWWSLTDYYGFSGRFCPACYDKVSHNSWGKPCNPHEHLLMVMKLGVNHA